MIEELKKNIETEIGILREIASYYNRLEFSSTSTEKKMLNEAIIHLTSNFKIINDSIPSILDNISAVKKLPSKTTETGLSKVTFSGDKEIEAIVNKEDKERFLRELSISESLIKRLKKKTNSLEVKKTDYQDTRGYIKLANKLFFDNSRRLIKKGYFAPLSLEIKKANLNILLESYVSMMVFSTVISAIVAIFLAAVFIFFNLGETFSITKIIYSLVFVVAVPFLTFIFLYFYPSTEKSSISSRIDQELPFAVIHMSAISGSGIAPTEIFRIVALSRDYPFLKQEVRKILNQINLFGYDLVTALTNVSKTTPSEKLSELLSGIATTINSGGNFQEFFRKRAETLLLDYRLEREKYIKVAETSMDIYISVVIAAPMVLMVLLILMAASKLTMQFTPIQITLAIITVISLINIIFLILLNSKQPTY
jgi:flagellar protein FlaJ